MKEPVSNYLTVARDGRSVLVGVVGLGNMHLALTLDEFVSDCLNQGILHIALDLHACNGLDSTFMGTLIDLRGRIGEMVGGWFCLLNVSESNEKLLKMIGVWPFLVVKDDVPIQPVEVQILKPGGDASRRLALIRQAHQHLVAIDERNRERFGHFLSALEREMGGKATEARRNHSANP